MKIKKVNWLFAALAFFVSSGSMLGTAHAFHVRIDCHSPFISSLWTGTTSTVQVWVEIDGSWNQLAQFVPGPQVCDADDEITIYGWLGTHPSVVDTVWITGGDELFWVDQVKLLRDSGTTYATVGAENGAGYCITYDENQDHATRCINHPPQQGLDFAF